MRDFEAAPRCPRMGESDVKGVQKLSREPLTEDGTEVVTLWPEVDETIGDGVVHSAVQDGKTNTQVLPDANTRRDTSPA